MEPSTTRKAEVVTITTGQAPAVGSKKFLRLIDLLQKQYVKLSRGSIQPSFALTYKGGSAHEFGTSRPVFTLVLNNDHAVSALSTLDQTTIIEAYLTGSIDINGDIMGALALRELFNDKRGAGFLWRFVRPLLFGQVRSDKKWISSHYDTDADFFTLFLDTRHRAYSQAVFLNDDEALEDAQTRKLDFALAAVGAKPGDHILDIGSGWGAVVEHAGRKGIRVTSLTISERSKEYVQKIIDAQNLPCEVLQEHFFEHSAHQRYDAIINCGVTEHLPDYAASLKHYSALLKPGGCLYLDASADKVKNGHGSFMGKYVFEGNASLLCLHEYLAAVAKSSFQLKGVWDDRHNYYLTTKTWAEKLEANRFIIERRWGKQLFRIFQLYLWGSAEGFHSQMIGAYRLVLKLPEAS
ncbi:methyltransferase domain-containing protein [Segetibacter sp. 3557_3]|uniref:SAM-dependent methyltransferase n=1 Tax=Segetibacter sp. 3557_3 TaxID=2547429 RepID=UPI00105890CB|nr:class I SAM-dependent methyltransferase [Segetibacter sp. 3557_3]TDH21325.1 methyltransferase domain-containing protein [Segetibacter sp. 3557_3]